MRETKTNLSSISAGREAFIERKLAEKRRLDLSSIKLSDSIQDDGLISIDLCTSNRDKVGENETKGKSNKNEDSVLLGKRKPTKEKEKEKIRTLSVQKSPTEKSVQKIKERITSPKMTKSASKKEVGVTTKNQVLSPSKNVTNVPPLFKANNNAQKEKEVFVSPLGSRRRSKSVLLTKEKEPKFQGFYIETDSFLNSDIQGVERDTPRLPQSTNEMEPNFGELKRKTEEVDKEKDDQSEIIKKLQEEVIFFL